MPYKLAYKDRTPAQKLKCYLRQHRYYLKNIEKRNALNRANYRKRVLAGEKRVYDLLERKVNDVFRMKDSGQKYSEVKLLTQIRVLSEYRDRLKVKLQGGI